MSIKDKINEDIKTAFKSGAKEEVSTLRFLSSVIKNKELEKRARLSKENKDAAELEKLSELSDEEVTGVVSSEIKKRKDSITQYEKGGRDDLVKKEMTELEILKKYAPAEMPEEELRALIKNKIAGLTAQAGQKDFGKTMGIVMAEVKGRADGEAVKRIIEEEMKNET
ncbi:MAG: GatB/YqeY domain-containing protein [Candidatus Azambacteria bacterium]|nr:GatB/YqeY domain-containing protein [Candidatus Azambacteria bacterium]